MDQILLQNSPHPHPNVYWWTLGNKYISECFHRTNVRVDSNTSLRGRHNYSTEASHLLKYFFRTQSQWETNKDNLKLISLHAWSKSRRFWGNRGKKHRSHVPSVLVLLKQPAGPPALKPPLWIYLGHLDIPVSGWMCFDPLNTGASAGTTGENHLLSTFTWHCECCMPIHTTDMVLWHETAQFVYLWEKMHSLRGTTAL